MPHLCWTFLDPFLTHEAMLFKFVNTRVPALYSAAFNTQKKLNFLKGIEEILFWFKNHGLLKQLQKRLTRIGVEPERICPPSHRFPRLKISTSLSFRY